MYNIANVLSLHTELHSIRPFWKEQPVYTQFGFSLLQKDAYWDILQKMFPCYLCLAKPKKVKAMKVYAAHGI